jgi:hypothetical protein
MKLYLASVNKPVADFILEENIGVGILCTYAIPKIFESTVKWGFTDIMLDSGAFSVDKSGTKIDIDSYIDFIKEHEELDIVPVSLDVIADKTGKKSMKNWLYMLDKGVWTLPTYHVGEPFEILDFYVENSDYVGLGGMARDTVQWRTLVPNMETIFNRHNHKYHAFGINDFRIVKRFPFYSVDALTWKHGSMFGRLVTPFGTWHLSSKGDEPSITYEEAKGMGLIDWLAERGVNYPFPEDFDYQTLNKLNIQALYDEIVAENRTKFIYNKGLF